jgi:abequosyltransferase
MKKQPVLSICIATYNRARFIGETLESIIPQLTDDTELVVVDGASTDNTESIVQKFASVEPRLRYVRLSQKGGVDQDYCKAVEMAEGEFCWLFTDDDLLKPGAVKEVSKRIRDDVSLIIVNAEVWNSDFTEMIVDRMIKSAKDIIYENSEFEKLFVSTANYLSFIGGVVIRRAFWLQRERSSYFGSEFVHVGVIFQAPLSASARLIADPYICIRYGNAQWRNRNFEIWMYKWPRLLWSFTGISPEVKQSVTPKEPWRNLYVLAIRRAMGAYSLFEFRNYVLKERVNLFWKLGALLLVLLPFRLVNKIFIFRYHPKKEDNKLLMQEFFLADLHSRR